MAAVKAWSVCVVAGAELRELTPLVRELRAPDSSIELVLCASGEDADLGDHEPLDHDLRGSAMPVDRTARLAELLVRSGDLLDRTHPTAVLVYGNGDTALSAALAARHRDIPVVHVGPRTFVTQLAALHLDGGADALVGWLRARDAERPAAPKTRAKELWVAGFPSPYGGADTELDHQIALWRRNGVDVHLVPMFGADDHTRARMLARGCHVHAYRDDIFRGKRVVSYCNGEFLAHLPRIMARGRPAQVIWFNCMTWLFDAEREAHRQGWIDVFGFVSAYQRAQLEPQLRAIRDDVGTFDYRAYFDASDIEWRYRPWESSYRLGRISRDDAGKFAPDTWRIFDRVIVPSGVEKKVYILGYGPNAAGKVGPAPAGLDWQTWGPSEISASDFYRGIDTLVHKTGGSRESYCRVVIEAYAHGVVPIVEDDYAFSEIVRQGETGFRCRDSDEMSWHASLLAHDPARHRAMAERGRAFLVDELSDEAACWRGWASLLG